MPSLNMPHPNVSDKKSVASLGHTFNVSSISVGA